MPTFSEQPSYVAYDGARKQAFFCILLGFLAAQVGRKCYAFFTLFCN